MSASREKKKRQENLTGGIESKAVRAQREELAEKKELRKYALIAVAFVVLTALLLIYNSGIIQKNSTAAVVDGESYTAAEMSYYYYTAYQNTLDSFGNYSSLFGLDTSKSLKSQTTTWGGKEQTWHEYFIEQGLSTLQFVHAAAKAAEADGVTLDESDLETFNTYVETMKTQAALYGYTYESYLQAVYGSYMTPEVFEEHLKLNQLASKYTNAYEESLSFTEDEVESYYNENRNSYDFVDGAYVVISGTPETQTDADGNTIEATEEEKAAAMAAAKETAEHILSGYHSGKDLETLAEEADATCTVSDELTYSASVGTDWLFDSARKSGDTAVLEDEELSRYFVVIFNSRRQNDAPDYDVRHILIASDSLELAEGEEATDEMLQKKSEEILAMWDGTEEGFATLAETYSLDTGSSTNGGLYENVNKGDMASEFEDWCYAVNRQPGDTGIVASSYGYHIMYFVGLGDTPYWYTACESALINDAFTAWETSLVENISAETAGGMRFVG